MSNDPQAALERQETIWTGLYGPQQAAQLRQELARRLETDPGADLATLVAEVEPADDDNWEETGLHRPGFG